MNKFDQLVSTIINKQLRSLDLDIIQVNLGLKCNQSCAHCHLEASPARTEMMDWPTMELVLQAAEQSGPSLLDLTGGAPELNPYYRRFVHALRKEGFTVQSRTNLTALLEPGLDDLPEFWRDHEVQLAASMPCYLEENVRAQRGPEVYEKSVKTIKRLNGLGYGVDDGPALNLVYNPGGPFLPPDQSSLEADYKRELAERFGISFTRLLTITNMPIGRFRRVLMELGKESEYLALLMDSFNGRALDGLMCRHQISVGWDGTLYDCDFNLALGLPLEAGAGGSLSEFKFNSPGRRNIITGVHCFACTAGAGSSCGGSLA